MFKSDRCGIETTLPPNGWSALWFKSDRCGIETWMGHWQHGWTNNVQIRPLRDWNAKTKAPERKGLAVQIRPLRDWNIDAGTFKKNETDRSNQTVAGLKHWNPLLCCGWLRFKSDRCGIETNSQHRSQPFAQLFKSDRCGIETIRWRHRVTSLLFVQIRPLRDWNYSVAASGYIAFICSNQTVAGLKHISNVTDIWYPTSSNQTVAGLKHYILTCLQLILGSSLFHVGNCKSRCPNRR